MVKGWVGVGEKKEKETKMDTPQWEVLPSGNLYSNFLGFTLGALKSGRWLAEGSIYTGSGNEKNIADAKFLAELFARWYSRDEQRLKAKGILEKVRLCY